MVSPCDLCLAICNLKCAETVQVYLLEVSRCDLCPPLCKFYFALKLCILHFSLCILHFTLCSLHFALFTFYCALCSLYRRTQILRILIIAVSSKSNLLDAIFISIWTLVSILFNAVQDFCANPIAKRQICWASPPENTLMVPST